MTIFREDSLGLCFLENSIDNYIIIDTPPHEFFSRSALSSPPPPTQSRSWSKKISFDPPRQTKFSCFIPDLTPPLRVGNLRPSFPGGQIVCENNLPTKKFKIWDATIVCLGSATVSVQSLIWLMFVRNTKFIVYNAYEITKCVNVCT